MQAMYQSAKIPLSKTDIAKQIMCAIARYANEMVPANQDK